jgi:hypothetical protein
MLLKRESGTGEPISVLPTATHWELVDERFEPLWMEWPACVGRGGGGGGRRMRGRE